MPPPGHNAVALRTETLKRLYHVIGNLTIERETKVTISDAVEYLLDLYDEVG